ncbi:class I SAM-dependent methyltransferase [Paralimibaculum aggregatum]|uniref:Class I SAM-dependent methyltransferase n=1 Tax=Paralimibaculum aggregatum TaxID=3036245 RepID=A0ABQ6LTX4_9RHOB|nr:class I SAM-dependent methyltransferase [Limibaculum sp. NKW23]GMG85553.1 class I SAM-dependent methyltransferase [Limibaculum sp. NKW23]
MRALEAFSRSRSERYWNASFATLSRGWWSVPVLQRYVDRRVGEAIAGGGQTAPGLTDAVLTRLCGRELGLGISIGCGRGVKERRLLEAGVVRRMRLFEISAVALDRARADALAEGLSDRVDCVLGDAFEMAHPAYDLVYWDHSLHHMADVDRAIAWSVAALRPGGWLLINDYVGPRRLQWPWSHTRKVRQALADIARHLPGRIARPRYRLPFESVAMAFLDPSEAPQSHLIRTSAARHTGMDLTPIGGCLLCMASLHLAMAPGIEQVAARVIDRDRRIERDGISYHAAGLWQKPA